MARNEHLHQANVAKKDEFYTQLTDIEKELCHYKEHFRGKTVFCNCDDPYESNFFKYFAMNFNILGLKKLICTCHVTSPISQTQLSLFEEDCYDVNKTKGVPAYKAELTEIHDQNGDGAIDLKDVELTLRKKGVVTKLKGDGDFRSEESIELLKEADIVVTNPPFSLFREYVAQLMEYEKKFIIISNMNAITYKEFFPLIMNNKVWVGYGFNLSMVFKTPYPNILDANRKFVISKGYNPDNGYVKTPAIAWFTNLDIKKRHEKLDLIERYTPEKFPTYDNYDAINIDKVLDIPFDYDGVMGVPITFFDKYNPNQFEVIGMDGQECSPPTKTYGHKEKVVNGERMESKTGTMGCVIREGHFGKGTYFDVGYPVKAVYKRVFIRKKA